MNGLGGDDKPRFTPRGENVLRVQVSAEQHSAVGGLGKIAKNLDRGPGKPGIKTGAVCGAKKLERVAPVIAHRPQGLERLTTGRLVIPQPAHQPRDHEVLIKFRKRSFERYMVKDPFTAE